MGTRINSQCRGAAVRKGQLNLMVHYDCYAMGSGYNGDAKRWYRGPTELRIRQERHALGTAENAFRVSRSRNLKCVPATILRFARLHSVTLALPEV